MSELYRKTRNKRQLAIVSPTQSLEVLASLPTEGMTSYELGAGYRREAPTLDLRGGLRKGAGEGGRRPFPSWIRPPADPKGPTFGTF